MATKKLGCRTCRHILTTGRTCKSPAMRESVYCYYHAHLHGPSHRMPPPRMSVKLPPLDSPQVIRENLAKVCNLMLARKISTREAGQALYAIQMASSELERDRKARGAQVQIAPSCLRPDDRNGKPAPIVAPASASASHPS